MSQRALSQHTPSVTNLCIYDLIYIYVCSYIYIYISVFSNGRVAPRDHAGAGSLRVKNTEGVLRPICTHMYIYVYVRMYKYKYIHIIHVYMFIYRVFCVFQLEGYPTWLRGDWKPPFEKRRRTRNGVHIYAHVHVHM